MNSPAESLRALLAIIAEDYGDPVGELHRIREHAEGARETLAEHDQQQAMPA